MRKWKRSLKRIAAFTLAVVLAGTTMDLSAFAVSAAEGTDAYEYDEASGYETVSENDAGSYEADESCTCETDDPTYHAPFCDLYIAPEEPECYCVEKCTGESVNDWCDVCYFDASACAGGEDEVATWAEDVEAKWGSSAENLTSSGTWYQAVQAVNGKSASYIQLQKDIEILSGTGDSKFTGTVTLDLAGHSYEVAEPFIVCENANLTVIGEGTIGNNKLVPIQVNEGGTMTISGGTYYSGVDFVIHNMGTLNITGGSFHASTANAAILWAYSGKVSITGGNFSKEDGSDAVCIDCYTGELSFAGNPAPGGITLKTTYEVEASAFSLPEGFDFYAAQDISPVKTLKGDNSVYEIKQTCIVTFDAKGGSGVMADVYVGSGSSYTLPQCEFTAPNSEKFCGWKINDEVIQPWETITVDKSLNITAFWGYEIDYVVNGGNGTMDDIYVESGSTYTLPGCGFTPPEGATFVGWKINDSELKQPGDTVTVTGDLQIRPVWGYLVSFDANGGSGAMDAQLVSEKYYLVPDNEFIAPEGKIFGGWLLNDQTVNSGDMIILESSITLKAVWSDVVYMVNFQPNGGTGDMTDCYLPTGSTYELPKSSFTAPSGMAFYGWKIDGKVYQPGESITITKYTDIIAEWAYVVKFDANGGSGEMEDILVLPGNSITLPANKFTHPNGMYYDSWSVNGTTYVPGDTVIITKSTTVQANWAEAEYEALWGSDEDNLIHEGNLKDALAAAQNSSESLYIRLCRSIDLNDTLEITGGNFTLDLYGKKLSNSSGAVLVCKRGTNAELTITDTKVGGSITGIFAAIESQSSSFTINLKEGTLRGRSYGVYANQGKLNVSDGSITADGTAIYTGGETNIYGGSISGGKYGVESHDNTYIYGGTITGKNAVYIHYDRTEVYGGTICGTSLDFASSNGKYSGTIVLNCGENGIGALFPDGISMGTINGQNGLNALLAEGAAYWRENTMLGLADTDTSISGDVQVKKACEHNVNPAYENNHDGTHTVSYSCCNLTITEGHNYTYVADDNANTNTESCDQGCGHSSTITLKAPANLVYNGVAKEVIVEGEIVGTYAITYAVKDGETLDSAPANAGTYTASITLNNETVTVDFTIEKAEGKLTDITDLSKTYDGTAVTKPTFTTTNTYAADKVTVEYKEASAEDSTYTKEAPAQAGSYKVRITVPADDIHKECVATADFTITKRDIADAEIVLGESLTYNGTEQTQSVSSVTVMGQKLDTESYQITGNTATEAGTYTLTVTITDHKNFTGSVAKEYVIGKIQLPAPAPAPEDEKIFKVEMEVGITEVPEGLKALPNLDTPEEINLQMKTVISQKNGSIPQSNVAVYDVALMYSVDGGETWIKADEEHFPDDGLTVQLPYPEGTGKDSHNFTVAHMFTSTAFGKAPGNVEYPAVTKTAEGIEFKVTGLSPISVGWVEVKQSGGVGDKEPAPTPEDSKPETTPETGSEQTPSGDNTTPETEEVKSPATGDGNHVESALLVMLLAGAGLLSLLLQRKRNEESS